MRRARSTQGFTLVELMVTVAMLAILVVVTIPPVLRAMQRREAANAAQVVLDSVEFAKVQASARNHAYAITWATQTVDADGHVTGNGSLTVSEGAGNTCVDITLPANHTDVRTISLATNFPYVYLIEVRPSSLGTHYICIRPDGRVLDASTSQPVTSSSANYAAGDAVLVLQRFQDIGSGQPDGPKHLVVIPFNGATRLAFE